MRQNQKKCHRVHVKSQKDLDGYRRREERHIEGVPRLILGKFENSTQQIWMEELRNEPVSRLKEYSSTEAGHIYAKTLVSACCELALSYGYFIINENMVFFNSHKDIFAWINPDLLQNHIKIYLPRTQEGQAAMIRSIISYLKLWYKCDYALFATIKHLPELAARLEQAKLSNTEAFKGKSPEKEFMGARRNSVNLEAGDVPSRKREEAVKASMHGQLLMENRSTKEVCRSPQRHESSHFLTSSISNKNNSQAKFNQMTAETERFNQEFEHRTFNSNNCIPHPLTKSIGMNSTSNYFPNRTTSNKHHIVTMISQLEGGSNEYVKNNILLDEEKMKEMEREKLKKMKESLDGIGEQLNDLFVSNVENEEESEEVKKKIELQFESLLS